MRLFTSINNENSTAKSGLNYLDTQPNDNQGQPILVMLHGNSNSKEMFTSLIEKLSETYRIIAINLLGHGLEGSKSAPAKGDSFSYLAQAKAVKALFNELNFDNNTQVHILGASLGGHVAYELLEDECVASIATIGAPPIQKVKVEDNDTYDFPNWFSFAGEQETSEAAPEFDIMQLMGQATFTESEAEFWIEGSGINKQEPEYAAQLLAAIETHSDARPELFSSCISGIGSDHNQVIRNTDKNVYLLVGEHDHIDANKLSEFATSAGPHVSMDVISNGPHYAFYGAGKEDFCDKLKTFFDHQNSPELKL